MEENQSLNIAPIEVSTPEVESPKTQSESPLLVDPSTEQLISDIRKENPLDQNELDFMKPSTNFGMIGMRAGSTNVKGVSLKGEAIDRDIFTTKLSDGTRINTTPTFDPRLNNESVYAINQGAGEKWVNGLTKAGLNFTTSVLGGTIGMVDGLARSIYNGNLESLHTNEFSNWLDDLNKEARYSLGNYRTAYEKDMNILQSMFTTTGAANFWADDFMQGVSFMAGSLGTEALWAVATGGSSLALSGARSAARLGAKKLAKGTAQSLSRPEKIMKAYSNTIGASNAVNFLNNARFIYTAAGYESGVEARHSFNETVENFENAHKELYGRVPTPEEYSTFMDDAVSNSNKVFVANVGLVGFSNFVQFAPMFGLSMGVSKRISGALGKSLLGLGATYKKGVATALKSNKVQRFVGNTFFIAKAPFTEGFIEEGGQGVISRMNAKMLESRYNPLSMDEHYTAMEAAQESFYEVYGTKQGLKEVGLGVLIGGLGQVRSKFNVNQYSKTRKGIEQGVENLNKAVNKMTDAQKTMLERFMLSTQARALENNAEAQQSEGKFGEASMSFNAAQFSRMTMEDNVGLLDESIAQFANTINNSSSQELMAQYKLSETQVKDFKKSLIAEYSDNVNLYKIAKRIAEVQNGFGNFGENSKQFTDAIAFNVFMGQKSEGVMNDVSSTLSELVGKNEVIGAMNVFRNLDKATVKNVRRVKALQRQLDKVEKQLQESALTFSSTNKDTTERTKDNQKAADKITKAEKKFADLQQRQQTLKTEVENQKRLLEGKIDMTKTSFGGSLEYQGDGLISSDSILDSFQTLEELDTYVETLSQTNPQMAEMVDRLRSEYKNAAISYAEFNNTFVRLANPNFNQRNLKGLSKLFKANPTSIPTDTAVDKLLDDDSQGLPYDDYIKSQSDNLTEDEIFSLKLLSRLEKRRLKETDIAVLDKGVIEVISNEDYDKFKKDKEVSDQIKDEIISKQPSQRSEREQEIASEMAEELREYERQQKEEKGDDIAEPTEETVETESAQETTTSPLSQIKAKIDELIENINYLSRFREDGANAENKPKDREYTEFENLVKKIESGKELTPREITRYNNLREKINAWGSLEGTRTATSNLAELIEIAAQLDELSDVNEAQRVMNELTVLSDLLEFDGFTPDTSKNNYDIAQSYDKALVSKKGKDTVIHNISMKGFLSLLKNSFPEVKISDAKEVKIKIGTKTLKISKDSLGNLVINSSGLNLLNSETPFKIFPQIKNLSSGYSPLYIEIEGKLEPVATDFKQENDTMLDNEALAQTKVNDGLDFVVNLEDPYNAALIKAYQKAKDKSKALIELRDKLVIKLVNKDSKSIAVMKGVREGEVTPELNKMIELRDTITARVLEDMNNGSEINFEMRVLVSQVFVGQPNLQIVRQGEEFFVKEFNFTESNISKVKNIGYMLDGKVQLKERDQKFETFPFMSNFANKKRYKGQKIPMAIIEYNGTNYAYPITLKRSENNLSEGLVEIMSRDQELGETLKQANRFIVENGLDSDTYGMTPLNYQEMAPLVADKLDKVGQYPNIEKWLSEGSIGEILRDQATINIDLTQTPFHSPKIRVDMNNIIGLEPMTMPEVIAEEKMQRKEKEKIEAEKQEKC